MTSHSHPAGQGLLFAARSGSVIRNIAIRPFVQLRKRGSRGELSPLSALGNRSHQEVPPVQTNEGGAVGRWRILIACLALLLLSVGSRAQVTPEQQAEMLLSSAR